MRTVDLTALLGSAAAATEFAAIDWNLLMAGDGTQIGHVVKTVVFALWGWYTNRKGKVGATVPSGTPLSPIAPVPEGTKAP